MLPAAAILKSLEEGSMLSQGSRLTAAERVDIAEYLARQRLGEETVALPEPRRCASDRALTRGTVAGVNWGHDTNRFSAASVAGLTKEDIGRLELKWSFAFPGAFRARSQPAIGHKAVFFGSQDGTVYAMDLASGCMHWRFQGSAEVRTGIVLSGESDGEPLAFFGDILARLYAVNAMTGELVWQLKVDEHPNATLTGTPAYHDGALLVPVSSLEVIPAADPAYPCCTFRGSLVAIDGQTGAIQATLPGIGQVLNFSRSLQVKNDEGLKVVLKAKAAGEEYPIGNLGLLLMLFIALGLIRLAAPPRKGH